ncbi:VWA domain-containing protein [Verrucomicrobium spinosum]|uniref:VWA domain-containing protein n=1 Tax=Verrucomicrobium spinosum TaxID=2736 RepID=UPI0009467B67|nr:VWA domain-containing protein [Verrucomicrobium spinosum]
MTRPQYGLETRVDERSGRNIFIAIDTSKSMLADDVSPNRLGRAKLAAQDLLERLPNDRVGVIAFAGRSYLQAPLTNDHEAVIECIQSLDHTTIPRGGSSIASAIQLAVETIDKVKGREHGMVLFTDGQETDEATLTAARMAAQKGLIVIPVGVGTTEGALILIRTSRTQGAICGMKTATSSTPVWRPPSCWRLPRSQAGSLCHSAPRRSLKTLWNACWASWNARNWTLKRIRVRSSDTNGPWHWASPASASP